MPSTSSSTDAGKEITATTALPIPMNAQDNAEEDRPNVRTIETSQTSLPLQQGVQNSRSASSSLHASREDQSDTKHTDPMTSAMSDLITLRKSWKKNLSLPPPPISPCSCSDGDSSRPPPPSSPQKSPPAAPTKDDGTSRLGPQNTTPSPLVPLSPSSCPAPAAATSLSSAVPEEKGDKKSSRTEEGGERETIEKRKQKGGWKDKKGAPAEKKNDEKEKIEANKETATPTAVASTSTSQAYARLSRSQRSFRGRDSAEGEMDVVSSDGQFPHRVEVPLITPRYQHRQRVFHQMSVTNSNPDIQSPTSLLSNRTTECLTIQHGPMEYTEDVHFHAYDIFRNKKAGPTAGGNAHRTTNSSVSHSFLSPTVDHSRLGAAYVLGVSAYTSTPITDRIRVNSLPFSLSQIVDELHWEEHRAIAVVSRLVQDGALWVDYPYAEQTNSTSKSKGSVTEGKKNAPLHATEKKGKAALSSSIDGGAVYWFLPQR